MKKSLEKNQGFFLEKNSFFVKFVFDYLNVFLFFYFLFLSSLKINVTMK